MSKLKCRTIRRSVRQRWMMMMMPCRLVLGLLVLNMALAFPSRNTRQADPDYDEDQDKMDVEYYDELSTDEPEIEISTLSPDEDYSPAHVASLEEEEEEPEEELENEREDKNELPITPSLIPSGSGGVSMGPDTSGEEEIHITVTSQPEEFSGIPEETGPPEESGFFERVTITPTLKEEEELFSTTQTPPQEVTGSATGSGQPESPDPDVEVIEIDTKGMSTCLLCICLGGSVYCDDVKLVNVPPLPKDTTHFYARYNKITKINKSDFANLNKLKRIDLTSNTIWKIEDGALYGLPALEELVIRENSLAQLPALPASMTLVDASHNHLGRTSIQNEAFKDMTGLLYLYLTDNKIDHVPVPLPETLRSLHLQNNNIQMIHEDTFCKQKDMHYRRNGLEDIRLDGNPVILSRTPQAYVCLPRIPIGALV